MRTWQSIRDSALGRHVHEEAYAALVLSGGYEEAGDRGRFQVKAGDAVFHGPFEAHLDRFFETGAVVLNLRLPVGRSYVPGIAKVADPDSVVRVAERSCRDAVDLLFSIAISQMTQPADWPDELAAALMQNPSLKLSQWGEKNGIAPWTLSRGFDKPGYPNSPPASYRIQPSIIRVGPSPTGIQPTWGTHKITGATVGG